MKKIGTLLFLLFFMFVGSAQAATLSFTDDADWDLGTYSSTNSGPPGTDDQLQLDPNISTSFEHIWVALSGRDSVVRIDTNHVEADGVVTLAESAAGTGAVLGEYLTGPSGRDTNPSRTTVDQNGDVWVGNRNDNYWDGTAWKGSATKISANPTGTTSTGVWNGSRFDMLGWADDGTNVANGGTSNATDTAIEQYVRTDGYGNRTVAIDADNNVWVGGYSDKDHNLIDGSTGAILETENLAPGGYGGVVDGNGVLWSSGWSGTSIATWDPALGIQKNIYAGGLSYGIGVDNDGNIWSSHYSQGTVSKIAVTYDPLTGVSGTVVGTYTTGSYSRGVAVTAVDNNVWVANSGSDTVTRLANNGSVLANIYVGDYPTGVSVDSNGKIWVTNYYSNNVVRIDPTLNGGLGAVDLTIELGSGANPYNYSDMTGTVISGTTNPTGSWLSTEDSGVAGMEWDSVFWNEEGEGSIPGGTGIEVFLRAADSLAGLTSQAWISYLSGDLLGLVGQFLDIRVVMTRTGSGDDAVSPIFSDLRIEYDLSNPVPEPGTMMLMGLGLLLMGAAQRRKQN
jgi:streptogramin lyase